MRIDPDIVGGTEKDWAANPDACLRLLYWNVGLADAWAGRFTDGVKELLGVDELAALARERAGARAAALFDEPVRVEAGAPALGHHLGAGRELFRQSFTLWQAAGAVDAVVDPGGRLVSFADRSRLAAGGEAAAQPLSDATLLEIAATTRMLGPRARLVSRAPGDGALVAARVAQYSPSPLRLLVTIDTASRRVAAFRVEARS